MRVSTFVAPLMILLAATTARAEEIVVNTSAELEAAFGRARAGDVVRLMPGTYGFTNSVWTANDGTANEPILVTGGNLPDVRLDFASVEALVFNNAYWILENVWVNGICTSPADCQAGVGVKQPADGFIMRGCRISNWTQHVKAARDPNDEADDASLIANEFYNDVAIDGSPIDIVGGKRWYVADNFVHDFGGDMANGDYGIFLKGATSNGIVERNLVICGHLRPSFGIEVGISMGAGGTGFAFCPNMDCSCEDFDSIVRNNIVLNCTDAGMHTKRACGSKFYNNVIAFTGGGLQIQEDGAGAPVQIRNNVIGGNVYGGMNRVEMDNFSGAEGMLASIYANPGNADFSAGNDTSAVRDRAASLGDVPEDYCGTPRPAGASDLGPIEFPAACATFPWSGTPAPPTDGGVMGGPDATPGQDAMPTIDGGNGGGLDGAANAADGAVATVDGGVVDAVDAGTDVDRGVDGGCNCAHTAARRSWSPWLLSILLVLRRRRQ